MHPEKVPAQLLLPGGQCAAGLQDRAVGVDPQALPVLRLDKADLIGAHIMLPLRRMDRQGSGLMQFLKDHGHLVPELSVVDGLEQVAEGRHRVALHRVLDEVGHEDQHQVPVLFPDLTGHGDAVVLSDLDVQEEDVRLARLLQKLLRVRKALDGNRDLQLFRQAQHIVPDLIAEDGLVVTDGDRKHNIPPLLSV